MEQLCKRFRPSWIALCVLTALGCQQPAPTTDPNHSAVTHHHHEAPHGGTLVMLGDHVGHVELVLDSESGVLTAYVLDGEAEHPVRIAMPGLSLEISPPSAEPFSLELVGVADPLSGETIGDTSVFRVEDERLKGLAVFKGELRTIEIRGIRLDRAAFSFPEGNE